MKQIAEEAGEMDTPRVEESIESVAIPDLTGVTGFSYDDVAYNTVGQLSPAQLSQLREVSRSNVFSLAIGVGFVVLGFAMGFRIVPAIAMIFVLAAAVVAVRHELAYLAGEVLDEVGNIQTEFERGSESRDQWFLHVGGKKLEITKEAYAALIPGGPYRIYFIAGPNRAVGGQVLPGWRPSPPPEKKKGWFGGLSISVG